MITCLVYLDKVIRISRTFQKHLFNMQKMFNRILRSPLKPYAGEVATLAEKNTVPRTYCDTRENNYNPERLESE